MTDSNRQIITVSELNRDARRLLESEFPMLFVEGEISNLAQPSSGHWYFTLKDDKAQVRCAMFRNRNQLVRFDPRNGQQIIVRGRISLYEGRGEFQMIAEFLEDSGDGALRRAFDKLKHDLQAEGLFDASRKKPLPAVPGHIAIITSPTGAAIRDVVSVMQRRFPAVHLSIIPVQVQGEGSVEQIVTALNFANRYEADPFDLILLTRGGGSLEDLWSFNTEPVARAIAASQLPVVSAVGHETDVSIADFIADLRAPTPSAAAELITPDGRVWLNTFNDIERRLTTIMQGGLQHHSRELGHMTRRLRHPSRYLEELSQRLDGLERRLTSQTRRQLGRFDLSDLQHRLRRAMQSQLDGYRARLTRHRLISPAGIIQTRSTRLEHLQDKLNSRARTMTRPGSARLAELAGKLAALSPLATLERGYAIVTTDPGQHVVTAASQVSEGDAIRIRLQQGQLRATVTGKEDT